MTLHQWRNAAKQAARKLISDQSGATAIEYGLIAAGISIGITASVFLFGDTLNDLFFTGLTGMLQP